jgi:hypothetical protein
LENESIFEHMFEPRTGLACIASYTALRLLSNSAAANTAKAKLFEHGLSPPRFVWQGNDFRRVHDTAQTKDQVVAREIAENRHLESLVPPPKHSVPIVMPGHD